MLTHVGVEFELSETETDGVVEITATVETTGKTGVEMEALTAVSVAALTIYDMGKAVDRAMRLTDIRLIEKHGGKSGDIVLETQVTGRDEEIGECSLTCRLFATLRDRAKANQVTVELADGATVGALREKLAADYPALAASLPTCLVAVNQEFAFADTPLHRRRRGRALSARQRRSGLGRRSRASRPTRWT